MGARVTQRGGRTGRRHRIDLRDGSTDQRTLDALSSLLNRLPGNVHARVGKHSIVLMDGNSAVATISASAVRTLPDRKRHALSLKRHDSNAAIAKVVLRHLQRTDHLSSNETGAVSAEGQRISARVWCAALRDEGVPAQVVGSGVEVPGVGVVARPFRASSQGAARRFVEAETRLAQAQLRHLCAAATGGLTGVEIDADRRGLQLRIGSVELTLDRYGVRMAGRMLLSGDLVAPGSAVPDVRDVVDRRLAADSPATDRPAQESLPAGTELLRIPNGITADARQRALAASRRLRRERTIVPAVLVRIDTADLGTLEFQPVAPGRNPTVTITVEALEFSGDLRLTRLTDPLSMRLRAPALHATVARVWAAALIVYAELCCREPAAATTARPSSRGRIRPGTSRTQSRNERMRGRSASAPAAAPARGIQSIAAAIEVLQSVAGHVRRLQPGHCASSEKVSEAAALGIRLPPGHTWVSPHHRGGQEPLHVRWPSGRPLL